MDYVMEVRNLAKAFAEVKAVNGISFGIRAGECFGLLGPNGAGKTTTIEIMEDLQKPDAGDVLYLGQPVDASFKEVAGIQFQSTALQDFLTVRETLSLFHGLYRHTLPLEQLIDMCELGELLDRDNRKLSGGQRQRMLLAIALVNDPKVLFLDEPTTGLDPHARRVFWSMIESIKARGKTILMTTHYMEEAWHLCDRIAIMEKGKIITEGAPAELLKAHFDDTILSLPLDAVDFPLTELSEDAYEYHGTINISTRNIHATIEALLARKVSLERLEIRARTLDDLFVELTHNEQSQ